VWHDKSCGFADQTGTCQLRSPVCPNVIQPVCGCDGNIYGNECLAQAAGVDVSVNNSCTPLPGTFKCGFTFCEAASSYCQAVVGGAFGNPGSYTCLPLPNVCAPTASCGCLSGQTCGSNCAGSAAAGLTVTCQVP
jgi:hypothetical protein